MLGAGSSGLPAVVAVVADRVTVAVLPTWPGLAVIRMSTVPGGAPVGAWSTVRAEMAGLEASLATTVIAPEDPFWRTISTGTVAVSPSTMFT